MQHVMVRPRALVRGLSRALVLHPPRLPSPGLRRAPRAGRRRNGGNGFEVALLSLALAGPIACKLEGETATSALEPNAPLPAASAASAASRAAAKDVAPRRAATRSPAAGESAGLGALPAAATEARVADEPGNREANGPVSVYLAGDGSVKADAAAPGRDQLGWGQLLERYTGLDVRVDNRAVEGRSSRRFIDEGRLDEILSALLPGDYLLIGFGTSDADRSSSYTLGDERVPYYLEPTDFKAYLGQYIEGARERGAVPVLVTPPATPSVHCSGNDAAEPQARAIRELGRARTVPVVDLNADSAGYLAKICPAPQAEDFFASEPEGSSGPHLRENGARILAGFVAGQLGKIEPALLRPVPDRGTPTEAP